jgi:hypothetical protein
VSQPSLLAERTFRLCDVNDEALVILEPARLGDRPRDRGSYVTLIAELRQHFGRNGTLLVVMRFAWSEPESDQSPK